VGTKIDLLGTENKGEPKLRMSMAPLGYEEVRKRAREFINEQRL